MIMSDHKQASATRHLNLFKTRTELPIWKVRAEFLEHLSKSRVVIIEGPSGAGKTTQVPQWCLEHFGAGVVCTQPKRRDAISAAQRVAEESCLEVGYAIRFETRCSPETKLKFVTDGLLVREMMEDQRLSAYKVVILDQVEVRSVATDVLFAALKEVKDIKIVVLSNGEEATSKFAGHVENPARINTPSRFPPTPGKIPVPEIMSTDLTSIVLALKIIGYDNIVDFPFVESPPPENLREAINTLQKLGALDATGNLSEVGVKLGKFPVEPQFSKALLSSVELNCVSEVLSIVAMLSAPSKNTGNNAKAHVALLEKYTIFKQSKDSKSSEDLESLKCADNVRHHLLKIMVNLGLVVGEPKNNPTTSQVLTNIKKSLASGLLLGDLE